MTSPVTSRRYGQRMPGIREAMKEFDGVRQPGHESGMRMSEWRASEPGKAIEDPALIGECIVVASGTLDQSRVCFEVAVWVNGIRHDCGPTGLEMSSALVFAGDERIDVMR